MSEDKRNWKRPILIVLATAPIAFIVVSMLIMARSELAFDDARCPFQPGEERIVNQQVTVREEARTCLEGVEEHRWILLRKGQEPREIARRRLDASYFADYSWSAMEEDGNVTIEIRNAGQEPRVFRERPIAEQKMRERQR